MSTETDCHLLAPPIDPEDGQLRVKGGKRMGTRREDCSSDPLFPVSHIRLQ